MFVAVLLGVASIWFDEPVKQILAMAAETKCDLIVMGTSGVNGLSR